MKWPAAAAVLIVLMACVSSLRADEKASDGEVTVRRMTAIASAVVSYTQRNGTFPEAKTAELLDRRLREFVWKDDREHFAMTDEWGTPFQFGVLDNGRVFRLVSAGADRRFDRDSWIRPGAFTDRSEDIVMLAKIETMSRSTTRRNLQVSSEFVRRWERSSDPCH